MVLQDHTIAARLATTIMYPATRERLRPASLVDGVSLRLMVPILRFDQSSDKWGEGTDGRRRGIDRWLRIDSPSCAAGLYRPTPQTRSALCARFAKDSVGRDRRSSKSGDSELRAHSPGAD